MNENSSRVEILGVEFDPLTEDEAVECALRFVQEGSPHQIWTPSITHIMMCRRDPEFAEIIHRAELVVADGTPVVWMSKLLGTPLPERVTGADLTPRLCKAAAERGLRVFFFGASEGVAQETAQRMSERYPGLIVAGAYAPPMQFEKKPEENEKAIQIIREAQPDILFVALGTPRQEKWIHRHREGLRVPVMIGVGAAFNFITGREKRAPQWMRRWGLESAWRTIQRPREILGRLIRNAPAFFLLILDRKTYRSQKSLLVRLRPGVLAVLDAVVAAGAFVLAYALYFRALFPSQDPFPGVPIAQAPAYSTLIPFVVLINFLAILGTGLYARRPRGSYWSLVRRTAISAAATFVLLITFTFIFKEVFIEHLKGYSRGVFGLFGFFNFAGLLAIRSAVRKGEAILHRRGLVTDRLILVGNRGDCDTLAAALFDRLGQGQMPMGRICVGSDSTHGEGVIPDLGTLSDLRRIVAARKTDEIVIVDPDLPEAEVAAVMGICAEFNVRLSFLCRFPENIERNFRIRQVGERRLLSVEGKDLRSSKEDGLAKSPRLVPKVPSPRGHKR